MNRRIFLKLTGATTLLPFLPVKSTQASIKQTLTWKKYNGISYHQVFLMSYYNKMQWISHTVGTLKDWNLSPLSLLSPLRFNKVEFKYLLSSFLHMPPISGKWSFMGYKKDWKEEKRPVKFAKRTITNNIEQMYYLPMTDIRKIKFTSFREEEPKINKSIIAKISSPTRPFEWCYIPLKRCYLDSYEQMIMNSNCHKVIHKTDMPYMSWIYLPELPEKDII